MKEEVPEDLLARFSKESAVSFEIDGVRISADENSAPIITGQWSGADELTDTGFTYRELNEAILRNMARRAATRKIISPD